VRPTPSQTVGPFFSIGLTWEDGPHVVPEGTPGAFWILGGVFDGAGDPVSDAVVETWQAEGIGRSATDAEGRFAIHTVAAPYIDALVFARGLLQGLVTRIYFEPPDDPALATLLAQPDGDGGYRFDIHLQGERETIFFDV
jgi:protocatechuate 3,4-dioxygenase alpha subunit